MENCPICESDTPDSDIFCSCGYDFEKQEIVDSNLKPETNKIRIRAYRSIIKSKHWSEEVILKKRITEVQGKKYGMALGNRAVYKWSIEKTGKLLGEAKNTTSIDIKLAKKLEEYPELLKCKNKTTARTKVEEIETGGKLIHIFKKFEYEPQLRDYLAEKWNEISYFQGWELKGKEYHPDKSLDLFIDLLAYDHKNSKWIIIELKKGNSPDKTVGQTKTYIGWVKENLAKNDEQVKGIIISGYPPNKRLGLAISATSDIKHKIYYLNANGRLEFLDTETAVEYSEMSNEQKDEFYVNFMNILKEAIAEAKKALT